jgi:hypothetical protein
MQEEVKVVASEATSWWDISFTFLVAAFFGSLRYLQEFLAKPRPPFELLVFTIKMLTALGAGLIVALVAKKLQIGPEWTAVAGAIAGWAGADFINDAKEVLRDFVRRKAG